MTDQKFAEESKSTTELLEEQISEAVFESLEIRRKADRLFLFKSWGREYYVLADHYQRMATLLGDAKRELQRAALQSPVRQELVAAVSARAGDLREAEGRASAAETALREFDAKASA